MQYADEPSYAEFDIRHRILIVGTGAAGISAARELRRLGFEGELIMMGDEPEGPYDRPACSKGILTGHQRPQDAIMTIDPELDITWKLGRRALSCNLDRRYVEAHTGEYVYFDGLVIATGSRPVVPMDWPDDQPGMHILHGLPAAWDLRHELRAARRVSVVGGGVTGCEVACGVHELAREAVIVEPRPFLMGRAVGSVVGEMIAKSHQKAGIEMRLGRRVSSVDRNRGWWRLTLDDGSTVDSDLVVAAMGERPDVEWLEGTGLDISNGVQCDAALRAVDTDGVPVEGVVAAGSLANWPNPRNDGRSGRCGQWIAAQEQGQAAARTLMAGEQPTPAVSLLPRYWSSQLGLRIEVCGELDQKAEIAVAEMRPGRKYPARSGVLATYHMNGRLVGAVAVNSPRAFTTTARMMLLDEPQVLVSAVAPVSPQVVVPPRQMPRSAPPRSVPPRSGPPRSGPPAPWSVPPRSGPPEPWSGPPDPWAAPPPPGPRPPRYGPRPPRYGPPPPMPPPERYPDYPPEPPYSPARPYSHDRWGYGYLSEVR